MSTRNLLFNYVEKLNVPFLLLTSPPDYALRHPSQLLKSSHYFFFQLPRFPELMLSINDFKVVCCVWTFNVKVVCGRACAIVYPAHYEQCLFLVFTSGRTAGNVWITDYYKIIFGFLKIWLVINHLISSFLNFITFFFPMFKSNCT